MRSRVIPETDRPLSRLQLVRTVHLANRQDGIYPLPRHPGQNMVAKVAGIKNLGRKYLHVHSHAYLLSSMIGVCNIFSSLKSSVYLER